MRASYEKRMARLESEAHGHEVAAWELVLEVSLEGERMRAYGVHRASGDVCEDHGLVRSLLATCGEEPWTIEIA